jgi:hypothetical protein
VSRTRIPPSKRPARAGLPWTAEEDDRLRALHGKASLRDAAVLLERGEAAVEDRRQELGLPRVMSSTARVAMRLAASKRITVVGLGSFDSHNEAADALQVTPSTLSNCLRYGWRCRGFVLRPSGTPPRIARPGKRFGWWVAVAPDGREIRRGTCVRLAEAIGCSPSAISNALRHGWQVRGHSVRVEPRDLRRAGESHGRAA